MPPADRARRLSRSLQARFRIDLFSALVERDFERCLTETILAAEREAYQRGRDAALGQRPDASGAVPAAPRPTDPHSTPSRDAVWSTTT